MTIDDKIKSLADEATAVRLRAHAPVSGFLVGAAIETGDGSVFCGCNIENMSLGLTQCAERAALAAAISAGQGELKQIVIASDGAVVPCGACRQVLAEFNPDLVVHLLDSARQGETIVETLKLSDLLPRPFRGTE